MAAMPSARDVAGLIVATGRPATDRVPESAATAPVITLIKVDLPAPFSPTRAWTSPSQRSNDTPDSARTPAYDLVMSVRREKGRRASQVKDFAQRARDGFAVGLRRASARACASTIAGTRRSGQSPPTALRFRFPHTRTGRRSAGREKSNSCSRRARQACRRGPARSGCAGARTPPLALCAPTCERLFESSDDPCARPRIGRTPLRRLPAVSARPVRRNRIDGAARPQPRRRQDRRHIGRERLFQRLQRHQRIVRLLVRRERLAIDEVRLHVGARRSRRCWRRAIRSGR